MILGFGSLAVTAQQPAHKQQPADPKLDSWAKVKTSDETKAIQGMLRGEAPVDEAQFDAFFNRAVFPQFTQAANITYASNKRAEDGKTMVKTTVSLLPAMRRDFKNMFLGREFSAAMRDKVNALTVAAMGAIAADDYHPASRYNAMLLIADLNQDEASQTPYAPALPALGKGFVNPKYPDAVRLAALMGIHRHAKAGIRGSTEGVARIMIAFAQDGALPPSRSREAHDWLRRRAIDVLVAIYSKTPPTDDKLFNLLSTVIADKEATVELRCAAIEALLALKLAPPAGFAVDKLVLAIGMVGVDAYHRELAGSLEEGRDVAFEPGLKFALTCVQRGLAALGATAASAKVTAIDKPLADLMGLKPPDPTTALPTDYDALYDKLAETGAKYEAAVTGKPLDAILIKPATLVMPSGGAVIPGASSRGSRGGYPPRAGGGRGRDPYSYPGPRRGGGGRR